MDKKSWPDVAPKVAKSYPPNFPKRERLNKEERAKILSNGKTLPFPNLLITSLPGNEWGLSIVVRKGVGPACHRNHLKRIVREAYRTAKPACVTPKKYAVTILKSTNRIDFHQLRKIFIEG